MKHRWHEVIGEWREDDLERLEVDGLVGEERLEVRKRLDGESAMEE